MTCESIRKKKGKRVRPLEDLEGRRFGRWVVTRFCIRHGDHLWKWLCVCDCGSKNWVFGRNLLTGKSISCGCLRDEIATKRGCARAKLKAYKEIPYSWWLHFVRNASSRELKVNFTISDTWDLLEKQNFACSYTHRPLFFGSSDVRWKSIYCNCSLDRIDSSLPYSIDNCEWVWKPLNRAKGTLTRERFIQLACRVSSKLNQECSVKIADFGSLSQAAWNQMASSAGKKKRDGYKFSSDFAFDLLNNQGFRCKLSGEPITFPNSKENFKRQPRRTASIDRIDSTRGYEQDNIQWVHVDVNYMKNDMSESEFRSLCAEIASVCGYMVDA